MQRGNSALAAAFLLALALSAGAGEAFQLTDDFGGYAAASDGSPAWDVTGIDWQVDGGQFVAIRSEKPMPPPQETRQETPPYTQAGRVPLPDEPRGKATGFFHVEEQDGRWWVIDPKGRPFYVVGTDHANYRVHWCEKLGYAPYNRNMAEKFKGDEAAWAASTAERLLAWGFNSLGANHSPSLRGRGLAWMGFASVGAGFAGTSDICPKVHWTGFPNVFDPRFARYCEQRARETCSPHRDDPWLLGYFLDNELEWYGKDYREWSLVDEVFKKPADHSAKQALLAFLKERYPKIEQLNAAWGTAAPSYEAIAASAEPLRHKTDQGLKDKLDFLRVIADKYFSIASAAIRRHDPNHMILGCRFAGGLPPIGDIAGRTCDIFTINCYRWVDLETGEVRDFAADLARWHAAVKRPFMITEWSFPALDSGLPCKHGAGQRFDTQAQKAQAFTLFQRLLFATPFMVGSNYFMWVDEPAEGISSTFPEDSNYGLVNVRDQPYAPLVEAATKLHPQVYAIHSGRVPVLTVRLEQAPWRAVVENMGRVVADADLEITRGTASERRPIRVPAEGRIEVPLGEVPLEPPAQLPGAADGQPVAFDRVGEGWSVDTGVLRLVKERPGGDAFDKVILGGKELGRFVPVIWQDVGQSQWVQPDAAKIVGESNGPARLVLDIEFERRAASKEPVRTAVDDQGRYAPADRGPGAFRTRYRFFAYPGKPWFGAQFLSIENTDTKPWGFQAYFHYALSSLAGDAADDAVGGPDVPSYYLRDRFVLWSDPKAGLHYGIAAARPLDFQMVFWKDPAGSEHADVRREIRRALKPGERYAEPQPTAYVFGAAGQAAKRPWQAVVDEVRLWQGLEVKVLPVRKPQ